MRRIQYYNCWYHFEKRPGTVLSLLCASYFYNSAGIGCYLFCSEPASRRCDRHCHVWVRYIDTTEITVLMFVSYGLVFIQYSYYLDFLFLGPASRLHNRHHQVLVRYIDTTKITFVCISSLILSMALLQYCYCIMFYFKLTNGTMVKWWMVK